MSIRGFNALGRTRQSFPEDDGSGQGVEDGCGTAIFDNLYR